MGMADHLTCLLRNVYAGQEATVRTGHGTTDWFQIGKGVDQGCILSPCLFNFYAEYIMWNARLDEAQDGIKIAGRNINNLRHVDDTTFMAEGEEELKSLLMKVKEETEKASLKFNIQKIKIMGPSPIISWQIDGETVTDFIFLGSKITADGDCSHEIKRCLLLERKAMTNLDSLLKSRDITLPTKIHLVKAMVFPVVMYGCESWTIKKAEHWRIDALELWCWRRLLRVPWTARRSNQSILKEIIPKYGKTDAGAETPILWAPDVKNWLIGKDSDAGKDWGQEEKGTTGWNDWVASLTWWTWVWASSRCWWWTGKPGMMRSMGSQRVGHDWMTDMNWTEQRSVCTYSVVRLLVTPWTAACQSPLSLEFSRQEYESGLPFSTPGDLPDPRVEPESPVSPALAGRFLTSEPPGKDQYRLRI